MFTRWPALRRVFRKNEHGAIEVGKAADFTVLSADHHGNSRAGNPEDEVRDDP